MAKEDNLYDDRQMIPADNVDANGTPWATVGENIRHGSNGTPNKDEVLEMLSTLLGIKLSYEEVTCTLTSSTIAVDNALFVGHYNIIETSKHIVAFFVINASITEGKSPMYLINYSPYSTSIFMKGDGDYASLRGTIKLGVLLA